MATHPTRSSRILNVSVPPGLYAEIEAAARDEHRTKSELMREAFHHYQFARQWKLIRQWGAESVIRLNVPDEELEKFLG
jgi:hypothetical protein